VTRIPARAAVALVERAIQARELEASERVLSFQEDISRARLADGLNVVRAVKGMSAPIAAPPLALHEATPEQQAGHLPTFAEIFDSRELHGEMILGFEQDAPRLGKYEAVHSCLIYGLARSGKTSWLRGLIGQTILTEPDTRCDVLDPHAARPDSLIGSLPKTKHFHAIDAGDPIPALKAFGAELGRRLLSQDATFPPRILLIDELPALARKPYAKQLQVLCETTSQEGRKVNVFLLATAQDLRQKKIGDFRESLSSAYFFKGKPNQVGLFLDDPDAEKLYRKNVNRHGIALFSAADEPPRIMAIPECRPDDLKRLEAAADTLTSDAPLKVVGGEDVSPSARTGYNVIPFRKPVNTVHAATTAEPPVTTALTTDNAVDEPLPNQSEFVAKVRAAMTVNAMSLGELSRQSGVDKGQLSKILNMKTPLTVAAYQALMPLTTGLHGETGGNL